MVRFSVELRMPRYVLLGGSALLQCDYNVHPDHLHRVEWYKDRRKLFQFIKGRKPPFRNYTIPGAYLDWHQSNERQLMLRNLEFEASGFYSCEVSTQTPIYTKPSNDQELTVVQSQRTSPQLLTAKPAYRVGETLEANCTSSPARPTAHVTWLVNGKPVEEKVLRLFPHRDRERLTVQLSLELGELHVGPEGQLELTCLSTIPAFLGPEHREYADRKTSSVTVNIVASQSSGCSVKLTTASFLLSAFLFILLR